MKADQKLLTAIERLKRGEEGFEVLYSKTYNFVYARARHAMCSEQEALDLVREVYLAAYKNIGSLKDSICLYSWLGSILVRQGVVMTGKNSEINFLTEEHLCKEIEDISVKVRETAVIQQNAEQLRNIIERLPEMQKTVIIEYYYDGLKVEEIAELTGCSKETATNRLYLARKHLREIIHEIKQKDSSALCGFNTPMIIWAVGILLEDTRMSKKTAGSVYRAVCKDLGIKQGKITMGSAGRSMSMERLVGEPVRRKGKMGIRSIVESIAEGGRIKAVIIAAGAIAVMYLFAAVIYRQVGISAKDQQCAALGITQEDGEGKSAVKPIGFYGADGQMHSEQKKEQSTPMQYASDSWTQDEIYTLNTIVADWLCGLYDEAEAKVQLAAQLPGRICRTVYYPAGQYTEMQVLVNGLDQSVYVLSSLLGDNEMGSWFIYGK